MLIINISCTKYGIMVFFIRVEDYVSFVGCLSYIRSQIKYHNSLVKSLTEICDNQIVKLNTVKSFMNKIVKMKSFEMSGNFLPLSQLKNCICWANNY